jgi:hypothetical protein
MPWMRINVLQNLIPPMSTSRLVFSYCVVDRATVCQYRPARPYLKMFILKRIKLLELSAHLDLNGVILHPSLHLQDRL